MAPSAGSEQMATVRAGGLALLPWTRQVLAVLWGHVRLLLQLIYYSFVSVFQMFRFEVHVRITEQTAANPADSFLFSKLFEGDGSGMVGGSGHIPNFCGEMGDPFAGTSAAEALLRCGLMDELVSRKEDNLFGPQSSWEVGFSSDWTVFGSGSGDPPEEQSSPWSSEEDQNPFEFDNEESQNLWDSLCGSSDPYNPFHFSACTSTRTKRGEEPGEGCDGTEEEVLGPGVNILVSRSDSETSWSSSGGSSLSEEAEDLLRFFTTSDPYDPMSFTACSSTSSPPAPPTADTTLLEEEEDEEQQLWESLNTHRDPFHPLNFQACLQSASAEVPPRGHQNPTRPSLHQRASTHRHPETTTVPWTRPRRSDKPTKQPGPAHKKVRFSPVVHVHVMRSWTFARQVSRKGNWEEMARDRDRFQRRIKEAEASVGPCLSPAHRRKMRAYLDTWTVP